MAASAPRFVGLDIHKQSIVVSAVDAHQQVLLPARRVSLAEFESWATTHLLATDAVVLEASTNAWQFYESRGTVGGFGHGGPSVSDQAHRSSACQDGWAR